MACAPRVPPPTVRLAARVLWRRRRERARPETAYVPAASAGSVGLGEGYDSVRALVHHWDAVAEEDKARFAHAGAAASAFLDARLAGTNAPPAPAPTSPAKADARDVSAV